MNRITKKLQVCGTIAYDVVKVVDSTNSFSTFRTDHLCLCFKKRPFFQIIESSLFQINAKTGKFSFYLVIFIFFFLSIITYILSITSFFYLLPHCYPQH